MHRISEKLTSKMKQTKQVSEPTNQIRDFCEIGKREKLTGGILNELERTFDVGIAGDDSHCL